eukprot:469005_1
MAQAPTKKTNVKELVFEKVKFDPLSNPDAFGLDDSNIMNQNQTETQSPINVDSGWESNDEKKKQSASIANDDDEINYDKIEANIQRAKKKKKINFRAEMTSDSTDINDLLLFQSKEKNEQETIQQIDEELLDVGDGDDDIIKAQKKMNKKRFNKLMRNY